MSIFLYSHLCVNQINKTTKCLNIKDLRGVNYLAQ